MRPRERFRFACPRSGVVPGKEEQGSTMETLEHIAFDRRLDVLDMVYRARTGHIGGSMSCMDILCALYYRVMDTEKIKRGEADRDRFLLSKGHCAEALYAVLADRGFFPKERLLTYARFDTALAEHPTRKVPGIEAATGALGHGLSLAVGMAAAARRDGSPAHVYVLMGDGEQDEGSVWEAAMAAGKYGLENLTAIVDRNRLQISGNTEQVMPLSPLAARYRDFGWEAVECSGHNSEELVRALRLRSPQKPVAVIANTVKGYGSELMENKAEWHHLVPDEEQYACIRAQLEQRREAFSRG